MKTGTITPAFGQNFNVQPKKTVAQGETAINAPQNTDVFFGGKTGSTLRTMALAGLIAAAPIVWTAGTVSAQTNDVEQTEQVQAQGAQALTPGDFAEKTKGLPSLVLLYRGEPDNKELVDAFADHPLLKGKMNVFVYSMDQADAGNISLKNSLDEEIGLPPAFINESLLLLDDKGVVRGLMVSTGAEGDKIEIAEDTDEAAAILAQVAGQLTSPPAGN